MGGMGSTQLATQYADSRNLAARQRIYRFAETNITFGQWVLQQLDLPDGARVLELGCGHGAMWNNQRAWAGRRWELVLTDLSHGMVTEARRQLTSVGRVHVARADAQWIPFVDRSFDAVIANHMLYHVPDRQRCIAEVRRVLREDGKFFAATNTFGHLRELKALLDSFAPGAFDFGDGSGIRWFALENGAEQLSRHFAHVSTAQRSVALRVTEAQAIIDYALSIDKFRSEITDERLEMLERKVEETIRRDGSFIISTEAGMFTASGSAS